MLYKSRSLLIRTPPCAKAGLGWGMLLLVPWLQSVALSGFLALWLHSGLSPFQYTSGVRNLSFTRNQVIFSDIFGIRLRVCTGTENWSQKERAAKCSLLSSFSCLNLLENSCQCLYYPRSSKNIVAWLLPCAFYLSTGVQKQLVCVMITTLQMRRLGDRMIKYLTGICTDQWKIRNGANCQISWSENYRKEYLGSWSVEVCSISSKLSQINISSILLDSSMGVLLQGKLCQYFTSPAHGDIFMSDLRGLASTVLPWLLL